jgi:hypothetical protein
MRGTLYVAYVAVFVRERTDAVLGRALTRSSSDDCILVYCTSQFKVKRTKRGEKERKRRGNEEEGRANTVYAGMQVCGELVI